jgi:ABC-type sugar transport system permease subunit
MLAVLLAELWHHAGFYVLIFAANLAVCDRALSEAADIDGAGPLRKFFSVILPQLRPALTINVIYAIIQFLKTFSVVVVMTKGGPNEATDFVSYAAWQMFDQGDYGHATAMATVLFGIVMLAGLAAYQASERSRP